MKRFILTATLVAMLTSATLAEIPTQPAVRQDGTVAILVGSDSAARHGLWGITNKAMLENWTVLKAANAERAPQYVIRTGDLLNWPTGWVTTTVQPATATPDTLFFKVVGTPTPQDNGMPWWGWILIVVASLAFIGALLAMYLHHPAPLPPAAIPLTLNQNGWQFGGAAIHPPAPAVALANAAQPAPPVPLPGPARQVTVNGAGMNVTVTFAANGTVIVHTQP